MNGTGVIHEGEDRISAVLDGEELFTAVRGTMVFDWLEWAMDQFRLIIKYRERWERSEDLRRRNRTDARAAVKEYRVRLDEMTQERDFWRQQHGLIANRPPGIPIIDCDAGGAE